MAMKKLLSRRDFLKLLAIMPALLTEGRVAKGIRSGKGHPNVIILVCDAMSARHLSLYGYPRKTSPNMERFASHATVYHSHYSGGNFTATGTASLLTGTYPWTHRALHYASLIDEDIKNHNLFNLAGGDSFRVGYAQNPWVDLFLYQFVEAVDKHIPTGAFNLSTHLYYDKIFSHDPLISYKAIDEFALQNHLPAGSSFVAMLQKLQTVKSIKDFAATYKEQFPYGVPYIFNGNSDLPSYFVEDVFDGLIATIERLPHSSSLAYFHIYPPHAPCLPRKDFADTFKDDGWSPMEKPKHPLGDGLGFDYIVDQLHFYDEYIAELDAEFGRLHDFMSGKGIFEESYVILTSDHGELFERGTVAHLTPLLYEEVIKIPLIISAPGQKSQQDIFTPTSSVDLVPTLLELLGRPVSKVTEGKTLPGLGGEGRTEDAIYIVEAKENSAFTPISRASIAMVKGQYKLIRYSYPDFQEYELYDLRNDPEELNDLAGVHPKLFSGMQAELLEKLDRVNTPFAHE